MNNTIEIDDILNWWIKTFVNNKRGATFMRQSHGLVPLTTDQKKKLAARRKTNKRWEIAFLIDSRTPHIHIEVSPSFPQAEWARGTIHFVEDNKVIYISRSWQIGEENV